MENKKKAMTTILLGAGTLLSLVVATRICKKGIDIYKNRQDEEDLLEESF